VRKQQQNIEQEFREIGIMLGDNLDKDEWVDLYKKLVYWELELEKSKESGMEEVFQMQKTEANAQFGKFIERNYIDWLEHPNDAPILSHNMFKKYVLPEISEDGKPVFLILIDNLRYDQWESIRPIFTQDFWVDEESIFYSILPTTTQYSRNSIFAGMMPSEIERRYPDKWINDEDEGGRNLNEQFFLTEQLKRNGMDMKFSYNKVLNVSYGNKVLRDVPGMFKNQLNVIVYNFVDMLSHARTDTEIIKELAKDEAAYRSIVRSWLEHSTLLNVLKEIAARGGRVIITTDHGSIRVKEPSKIVGDKDVNTNLRYKQGKSLDYQNKDVLAIKNPDEAHLPKVNVSQAYVFAKEDKFFAYPNNYNHYVKYYKDTFQHGGISLEEMLIPVIKLSAR